MSLKWASVEGLTKLILDLRQNPGGLLDAAVGVVDHFIDKGEMIVYTKGRTADSFQEYRAPGKHDRLGVPVVVLINRGSASASEIVAGAIQDHDRGLVVGETSWGKGLVQTVYNLAYGAGLALTTAKYYTPSGRLIQRDYHSYFDYYTRADVEPVEGAAPRPPDSEAFATDLGRAVYGGGGITPDVVAEPVEIAPYLQFLLARAAFFNFGVDYARRHPEVDREWRPGPEIVDEFAAINPPTISPMNPAGRNLSIAGYAMSWPIKLGSTCGNSRWMSARSG